MKMKRLILSMILGFGVSGAAQSADQYVFGYSGPNAGNVLTVNGSTTLSVADSGWYFETGYHNPGNDNYIVGDCFSCGNSGEYRNWFVFDLGGLSGPVSSASFSLYSYDVTLTSGNYYLNDVSTSISSLTGGTGGVAAFSDLGTGTSYGHRFYQSATDSNQFHTIALNGGALASLNAAIASSASQWAIGGAFEAGDVSVPPSAVPEPETYAMMLAGLGLIGVMARRRKQKAVA